MKYKNISRGSYIKKILEKNNIRHNKISSLLLLLLTKVQLNR